MLPILRKMNNNNNGNGFASGFLIGVIVGAALVFLLATKKGKKLLSAISEEGLDNIADLVDEVEDGFGEEEELSEPESVQSSAEETKPKVHTNGETKKSPIRRFFKGVPKRS